MWKRILLISLAGVAAAMGAGFAWLRFRTPNQLPPETIQVRITTETIARGEYLFTVIADCDGCHTERDWKVFSAPAMARGRGRGFQFPKELGLPGDVIAPNITPDVETGIGAWTDGEKIRAIREGIGRDGRALFPMMPYRAFAKMSDPDAQALVAYMNTLPAVRNPLPRTALDFPVKYLIAGEPAPARNVPAVDPANKLEWGRYLATMGGCGGCHTPMDKGAPLPGMEFAGGEVFRVGAFKTVSANITPDSDTGIGKMSEPEFIERFHQYRKYAAEGPPEVKPESFTIMPWMSFTRLTKEELSAIYAFLRTVKPVNHAVETHPAN